VVTVITGTHTLTLAEEGTVLVSAVAGYTTTLPTAVGHKGLAYDFLKTDANYNLITLAFHGAEKCNYPNAAGTPQATYPRLNTLGAGVRLVSDGANWQCVNERVGQIPACSVSMSANQDDLTSGLFTTLALDTEAYDIGGNFDTGTYTFTTPIPGRYLVAMCVAWNGPSVIADKKYTGRVLGVSGEAIRQSALADYLNCDFTKPVDLAKDATLILQGKQDSGVNTVDVRGGNPAYTSMVIHLLSKD